MKKILTILLTLIFSILLVSCNIEGGENPLEKTTISHYVTTNGVRNTLVEEEVYVNPKVVAVFDLSVIDIFDYIGLEKFQIEKLSLVKGSLPSYLSHFNQSQYTNSGTLFDIDFEVLNVLLPDLIIIGGRSATHYDELKLRYPNSTILDTSNTNFTFERFEMVLNNLSLVFPNVSEDLETALEDTLNIIPAIVDITKDYSAAILMVNGDEYSVYGNGSRFTAIYDDFLFEVSDPNLQTENTHGQIIDSEYFNNVRPDIIFFIDRGVATGSADPGVAQAMQNPYILATPAGQNNHLYQLDADSWYILPGGLTSTNKMIDDINSVVNAINS